MHAVFSALSNQGDNVISKMIMGIMCLGVLLAGCGGGRDETSAPPKASIQAATISSSHASSKDLPDRQALQAEVERVRADNGLPGLAVVIVEKENIQSVVTGTKIIGGTATIAPTDKFQLGSLTKAATATLILRLVEQKKLRLDSTLAELFPTWNATMHPSMRTVTVEQLLHHRAGIKRDIEGADAFALLPRVTGDITVDRAMLAEYLLQQAPALPPDTQYAYSNLGYMVLGLIAEGAGGGTYASLMQKEVFGPLDMDAGLGLPEETGPGALSGHTLEGSTWMPATYPPLLRMQLALLDPAGGMMMSMDDYGKFLRENLRGLRWISRYLPKDTFRMIHTPVDGYGLGWLVTDDPVLGRISYHYGSVSTYYASTVIVPKTKRAVSVACNCSSPAAKAQIDLFAKQLAARR
jgi:CubicO group peptidase (beta-lactamase class C family)